MASLQGPWRRVVHVTLFEGIAVVITGSVLAFAADRPADASAATAIGSSTIAMLWNWLWNLLFEAWEKRQATRGRGVARRIAHAVGFELGLVVLLVPLFAWLLKLTLGEALLYNVGLVAFFVFYGFAFNLVFDRVFGLPLSAQGSPSQ